LSEIGRCEKILFLVSQSLDRKLSFVESLSLRWHFFVCKRCRRERDSLIKMQQILRLYREDADRSTQSAEEMLSDETKERIKEVLRKKMEEKKIEEKEKKDGTTGL